MESTVYARKYYKLEITTTPPVSGWQASFDHGATWHDGETVPGTPNTWRWLVRGPEFVAPPGDNQVSYLVPERRYYPPLRAPDAPEFESMFGPLIHLTAYGDET